MEFYFLTLNKIGVPMNQGKRTDLLEIKSMLDEGKTSVDIADSHFTDWVRYHKSFEKYVTLKQPKRSWNTYVVVLWGKTGTGKTRFARNQVGDDQRVWSPGDYKWFDGYEGQEIVIIDDYRGEYELPMFLNLFDRYPMQVPVKGGFTNWCPKKVYITSNVDPNHWYTSDGLSLGAFQRRLDNVQFIIDNIYDDIQ